MTRVEFIRQLRELGYTDKFIAAILDLKQREQQEGIERKYTDYIPSAYSNPA